MKKIYTLLTALLICAVSFSQIVLPLDFESTTVTYAFTDFAGGNVSVVANTQSGGINTSTKVAKFIKFPGQTYGGSFISLASPIDFSVNRTFKVKVFSPRVGAKLLLKVENANNAGIFFEREAISTVANAWEDLTFNFSTISTTNQYQKMIFIFDNGTNGDGSANFTFLFDDVRLTTGGGGPTLTQMNLPVTFDETTVDYGLLGFGGAEQSTIVTDPTLSTNKVAKVIKTAAAELWAGTTVTAAAGLGFSSRIPFTVSNTKMNVRVWSPAAGIPVRLKVEERGDPTHSVETEATVTTASGWQTLEFNFLNQSTGTAAINLSYNYDKLSIFFNFGTTGAATGERIYYFDDVKFGAAGPVTLTQMDLPVTFDATTVDYGLLGFGGAEQSTIVTDPTLSTNKVAKVIKTATAELWAGTTVTAAAGLGFASRIPFTFTNTKMNVRVWSPVAGIPVRLKVEERADATHSVETEATVTTASGWQTLEFNFLNQSAGTSAINLTYNYDKLSIFFNFGTTGAATGERTYYFDDIKFGAVPPPALTQMNLPVTFDLTTVEYGLVGFGGAEQSTIVTDPTLSTNKVAKVIKTATAELWAGTTVTAAAGLGFASRIPFTVSNTKMNVRVWSPVAGIPVRLKVEERGDPTHSVETEATVTTASGWQTLEFNFLNQSTGTSAINLSYNYDKLSIFFNFGTTGAATGERTYYFDDVKFGAAPPVALTQMDLPVTFDLTTVDYGLVGFGGAEQSTIVTDPTLSTNKVAKVIKTATAELWAGTTVTAAAGLGFASRIPFTVSNTKMNVRVWSPVAGIPVRLKVEERGDPTHSVETEATVTIASGWQTLEFNFLNQSTGTSAINLTYNYDKLSIFFNFGTTGAATGERTYYFDDVKFGAASVVVPTLPVLPLDFESSTINYTFTDFNGGAVTVINNPQSSGINTSSKVAKMVKSAGEVYGGSYITLAGPIDFSTNRTFKMKVFAPRVGTKVLLKVENETDASIFYEREVLTTQANAWEELTFNFTAINATNQYSKVILIFDLGTIGDGSANFTYLFDDLSLINGGGPTTLPTLPLDFESSTVNYTFTDFNGGAVTILNNPQSSGINTSSKVGKMVKSVGETYGGSFITLAGPIDFSTNRIFKMKVFAPRVGTKVLLKVENESDGSQFFEREVLTTQANAWEDLTFNFTPINANNQYSKVVLIFDLGTMGDGTANFTYLFDDLRLTNGGGGPVLAQMDLPVTFDATTVEYGLIGFGGAEQSTIVTDPTLSTNKVAKVIKTAAAELWAGTTVTAPAELGFASRIPFTVSNTKMNVRVWSPVAGIPVRLKVEEHGDPTHSVETEASVTTASGWQTLEFNFLNQSNGTAAINLSYNYDKLSIFFNFGTTGAATGERIYYFDDVKFGAAGTVVTPTLPVLPLDFESSTINYAFTDFNGGAVTVLNNPQSSGLNTSSKVAKMVKSVGEVYGGSYITLAGPIDFSTNKIFKMKVFAPRVGTKVLLKVENETDATISFEREVLTTQANAWEDLTFNFTAINATNQYSKVVLIFDLGTMGDGTPNFTYLFDDVRLTSGTGPVTLAQMDLPVTFDATATVDYGLIGFGGAEQSTIETDPTLSSNKVAKVIKSATAEIFAGTTCTAAAGLGFASAVPFTANSTKMSVRIWSPNANIPVRLKLEDHANPTRSVETESFVTVASGWQIVEFDFAQNVTGTSALNLTYRYDKATIFFNFGTSGAVAGEKTYYFDDMKFIGGGGLNPLPGLPLDFQSTSIPYSFVDFDGGNVTVVNNAQSNGINTSTKVAKMVKSFGQTYGGSSIILNGPIDFSVNRLFKMKVFAPRVGTKVLVKVENVLDGSLNFEKEAVTTVANAWEDLSFDFSSINRANQYQKVVFIFDNGTMGDGSANFTYLFDDVRLTIGGGSTTTLTQMNLPVTFEDASVDYGVIGFGGAEQSSIVVDPTLASNKVAQVIKSATADATAGTTVTAPAQLGFVTRIPFTNTKTKMTVRVWVPQAGITVRLKVEDHLNATHSVETDAVATVAAGWQTLVFDFSNEATGTLALNLNYNYDKATIFFNYGVAGSVSGEKTYYFDDMLFSNETSNLDYDAALSQIVLYPNPTIDDVNINNTYNLPLNICLYDALGRSIRKVISTNSIVQIDMTAYPAGVYYLMIENKINNKKVARKIVKQ